MSLPGLNVATPEVEAVATDFVELKESTEWRFEVAFGVNVVVKLLSGTAELFGTELAVHQPYDFTGAKAAIYTWHGCRLEVTGECQVEYIAEETPVASYANLHFALEQLRDQFSSSNQDGPRVLIVGPDNAGKTSLAKFLTAYATRCGRQAVAVNVDPREGMLSIPGTLTAATFTSILDVEEGWGSSPTNGPTNVPVKLPLVYFLGLENPEDNRELFKPIVSRLALSVMNRLQDDNEARRTGCIIDTPGTISQGKGNYELLQHIISEFSVNVIAVIGSERLYSDLLRRSKDKKTNAGGNTTVIKLDKSGGCVDRDDGFRQQLRQAQIREYFFGDAKTTLSPHTQQVGFMHLSIFRSIDSTSHDLSSALLPGDYDTTGSPGHSIFEKVTSPTAQMQNAVLAIVHAEPNDTHEVIRDASIIGFIFVAEVDEEKGRVKILAPLSGRLPQKAMIWGRWPEGSGDMVG